MDEPILHTKLYIPPAMPGELIARPRLTQRLDEVLARKLTLISAPAGYGKTTLVSQWLTDLRSPILDLRSGADPIAGYQVAPGRQALQNFQVAWVSLDEGDNDPVRFWTYVIAALETVRNGLGAGALSLLRSPQPSPLEVVLTFLLNDLATLSQALVLVLDDYHLIENTEIHTSLILFLDRLPPSVRLIITSRVDPPLPLARWRVKRQLAELRAEDLGFTVDEATMFFNHLMGLDLSVDNISALEAKTEGWIAGLQLAALSLQGRVDVQNFIAAFTGNHRYILDYVTEEVLHRQPDPVRTFLLQTAILGRLSGPLCDAITGRKDSQAMLEKLVRANLFTIPLDEQGQWYRYHHLFSDLLRHYLQQTILSLSPSLPEGSQEMIFELHRRAAAWYEEAGWAEEAIQHATQARDFERAGRLIIQQVNTIVTRGGAGLILRWFKDLPDMWMQSHPELGLLQAWLLFLTGHIEEVQRKLADFETILSPSPISSPGIDQERGENDQIPGLMAGLQAQIRLLKGDLPGAIQLSQQALAFLGEEDKAGPRSIVIHDLAIAYWISGEPEKANRLLADFGAAAPYDDDPATIVALRNMAELKRMQGQRRQAFSLYQQLLQLMAEKENLGLSPIAWFAHTEMGHLLYEWNDLVAAEAHLRHGISLGSQGVSFHQLVLNYIGLFRIYLAQENFDEAEEIIHLAEQVASKTDSGPLPEIITVMQVDLWLARNNHEAIAQWRQAANLAVDDELDNRNLFTYSAFARVLLAQGWVQEAKVLLARLLALWESAQHQDRVIEVLALQALTFQAQNNFEQAFTVMERALNLAEPEGYIRIFIDKGAPMARLLKRMAEREASGRIKTYLHTLLVAFVRDEGLGATLQPRPHKKEQSPDPQPLVEALTKREAEVLQLLNTALSGQEIADHLVISKSTLKVHLKRVYDKLGVKSRPQAVVKAKELGLI